MTHLILSQISQLVPAPILGTCVWGMMTLLSWSIWAALREAITRLTKLHQIPCDRCLYFTGDYRLKCTVNPCVAFTEDAIDCRDFAPASSIPACAGCSKRFTSLSRHQPRSPF